MTRGERERWLHGRKVHGVLNNFIACNQEYGLASGWAFSDRTDLREITCRTCRKVLKKYWELG